jgi:hypothetical protein
VPRARDCHDLKIIETRTVRLERWRSVRSNWGADRRAGAWPEEPIQLSDPAVARWTPLIDAFAAGLFYYWIGTEEILREGGARHVAEDPYGKLWESDAGMRSTHLLLEVTNGTTEPDGTRRVYFLRVPPEVMTPREAVTWTYGLSAEQYELAVRT